MMYDIDRLGLIEEYTDKLSKLDTSVINRQLRRHFIRGLICNIIDRTSTLGEAGLKKDIESLQYDLVALGDENNDLLDIIDELEGKSTSKSMWWGVVLVDGTIEVDHYHDDIEMYEARDKGTAKAIYGPFESLTCISAHMKIEELYENDNPTKNR